MKRSDLFSIVACLALGVLWLGIPASPAAADSLHLRNVANTITDLERSWVAAIVTKDIGTLDRLLAPEFNGTSPTGFTYTKDMAISDIKSGVRSEEHTSELQ